MRKKTIKYLCFVIIMLFAGETFSQESFYVYFMQNGKRINIKKSKIELKNIPFEIFVEYTSPVNLYVHVSDEKDIWKKAVKGKLLQYFPQFKNPGKDTKTLFDEKNTLVLNTEKSVAWKKNQSDTTPDIKNKDGRFFNIKKVLNITVPGKKTLSVGNFKKDLFLVFLYTEKDKYGENIEIQREAVKIKWVKKYKEEKKSYEKKKKREAKEKIKQAKYDLKRKQKFAKKEKKRIEKLERLEKEKQEKAEKEKKKAEKKANKKQKKENDKS